MKKKLFLTYFSHFLVTREKAQKFLQHISHLHKYTYFAHPIDLFALPILQEIRIYHVWFLFGVVRAILEQSIDKKKKKKKKTVEQNLGRTVYY